MSRFSNEWLRFSPVNNERRLVMSSFTGAPATVLRACLLSACAMGITSEIKMRLTNTGLFGDDGKLYGGVPILFIATLFSSFAANMVANPFDVVKSRMQNIEIEKD